MPMVTAQMTALLAQMDEDFGERDRILEDFFPTELDRFIDQLEMLRDAAKDALRMKGAR
jgi:hypothetical protein